MLAYELDTRLQAGDASMREHQKCTAARTVFRRTLHFLQTLLQGNVPSGTHKRRDNSPINPLCHRSNSTTRTTHFIPLSLCYGTKGILKQTPTYCRVTLHRNPLQRTLAFSCVTTMTCFKRFFTYVLLKLYFGREASPAVGKQGSRREGRRGCGVRI